MSRSRAMVARILRNRDLRRLLGAFLAFNAAEYATWVAVLDRESFLSAVTGNPMVQARADTVVVGATM